jgi:hypothetical protein
MTAPSSTSRLHARRSIAHYSLSLPNRPGEGVRLARNAEELSALASTYRARSLDRTVGESTFAAIPSV